MSLKEIINSLQEKLEDKAQAREEILSASRRILTLSKQAIMAVHRGEREKAEKKLEEAGTMLRTLDGLSARHPDLIGGAANAAYQEYAEAQIYLRVVEEGGFPVPEALGVPTVPYLLGLADVIGEFRRRALDSLRRGELEAGERCLQTMEDIYGELVALEAAYSVAPELRRKCDIARRVIEATRGDLTIEARRSALERSIRRLEERMELGKNEV